MYYGIHLVLHAHLPEVMCYRLSLSRLLVESFTIQLDCMEKPAETKLRQCYLSIFLLSAGGTHGQFPLFLFLPGLSPLAELLPAL